MINVTKKVEDSGNKNILITERGASFGYNTLVSRHAFITYNGKKWLSCSF